jgi:hypothetical protein
MQQRIFSLRRNWFLLWKKGSLQKAEQKFMKTETEQNVDHNHLKFPDQGLETTVHNNICDAVLYCTSQIAEK